jgi:uncharacterized membrane protein YdjX (TVP38/TMEM64 family)/pimeloyl-ACP methyl ester carboxylesterase
MKPYSYANQLRSVFAIEIAIVTFVTFVSLMFWTSVCTDSLSSCIPRGNALGPTTFLLLSFFRPFVLTPHGFLTAIAGQTWGPWVGALMSASGGVLSCLLIMLAGRLLGRRLVKPWLASNLPATWRFMRSQDYKIVFFLRLVPLPIPFAFDIFSLLFGVAGFRLGVTLVATFIGSLPEAYLYARIASPASTLFSNAIDTLGVLTLTVLTPMLVFEWISRKKGSSLWARSRAMWGEIVAELRLKNEIVRRAKFDPDKTPVLLLYGFFSTRRALTVLEKHLVNRGHEVMSFNLGGLLGVLFTRSILDTASFIDYKIKRQVDRHGFRKVHIVAHSKGGFVALWWVLKLGGAKLCDKVVTMGTPFAGSRLTYLALVTPLGLFWRDVWQMRPRSSFLRYLQASEVPDNVKIYCMYSRKDGVAKGHRGIFRPEKGAGNVVLVPMNHVAHFDYLYRRDVADAISRILNNQEPFETGENSGQTEETSGSVLEVLAPPSRDMEEVSPEEKKPEGETSVAKLAHSD